MTLTQIVELSLFDNADILGNYSDITILRLENGNYYVSFDPFENTNKQHKSDNNIFFSENIEFAEVQDNGIGFEQKYDQQIFVIFQRLNRRDEYDGTGIGLSICKKIVDNHRGIIFVESNLNEGSTFHIILPIHQPT